MTVFGHEYASAYDALYDDKDYERECDLFERLFARYGAAPIRSLLDLGCGTGGHSLPLAHRGYAVVGVDRSAGMLAVAEAKAAAVKNGDRPAFTAGDLRTADIGRPFDAVLMPFAVLGYQLSNADVLAALRGARRHLTPGGLLVLDVWHGPAVLIDRPSRRVKTRTNGERELRRSATATLDTSRHLCSVHYHLQVLESGRMVSETSETHAIRFFFPLELQLFLETAGFSLEHVSSFPDIDQPVGDHSWNVLVVARAA